MLRMCWKKAVGDLWSNKSRTLLVLIAMIIGITGVGAVLNARAILKREMDSNYMKTNPASATLMVEGMNPQILDGIKAMPEIGAAEMRRTESGRLVYGDKTGKPINLYIIDDFSRLKVSTFSFDDGAMPPQKGEILIERAAKDMVDVNKGEDVGIKLTGIPAFKLRMAGIVHAPALPPAWMEGLAYGFISRETYEAMGGKENLNELKFVVSKDILDKKHIQNVTAQLKNWLEQNGVKVVGMDIPNPGRHPHASQMDTLMFLLEAFGLLTLVLSAIIVASMISALLTQQIRQIGIMKAIGAKNSQITAIYTSIVLMLGVAALVISIPLAFLAGRAYAGFAADMLNFEIFDGSVPLKFYLIEIAIGLLLPLFTAMFSIVKGSRITVREAIQDYGTGTGKSAGSKMNSVEWKFLSRPLLLSLRNTFRKKGRLIFTLGVLSLGGALFITAMNVAASMNKSTTGLLNSFRFDVSVRFSKPYAMQDIEKSIRKVQGVKDMEIWGGAAANVLHADGLTGRQFSLIAIPTEPRMLSEVKPSAGRWLKKDDEAVVVVNQALLGLEPDIRLGDTIRLKVSGNEIPFKIEGVVDEILSEPKAYVNQSYFQKAAGQEGMGQNALITLVDGKNSKKAAAMEKSLENALMGEGYEISSLERLDDIQDKVMGHLMLLAVLLVAMSLLGVIVGGLGLTTTMSVNVLERTREIGVMRAIGASTRNVFGIILHEGALIGGLSWVIATLLSIPFGTYISRYFGEIFFDTPLKTSISAKGILIWFVLAVVFAVLSSLSPAGKAARMPVRESLAYE